MKKLYLYLKPYMPAILVSMLFAGISAAASLAVPIYAGRTIDCMVGIGAVDMPGLLLILRTIAGVALTGAASSAISGRINIRISTTVIASLRRDAFGAMTRLSLSEIDSHSPGDLQSRIIADADAVGDGILLGFSQLFSGILTILGTIIFLFMISPAIAPVVVILTPLSLFTARFISSRSKKYFTQQAEVRGELTQFCQEQVEAQRLLHAFGAHERSKTDFNEINNTLSDVSLNATFFSSLPNPSSRFVNNLIYMAVGMLGALYAISGGITVGALTSFLAYASGYAKPFNEITGVWTELQNAVVCAGRLFELMEMEPEKETGNEKAEKVKGDIDIRAINFSYDHVKPTITDFSLSVKKGAHVAIVGPTGAGKTTLVNLLMRFYDPDSGSIALDGNDVSKYTRRSLRSSFGMVLQETWLREGSVRDNLTLGRSFATDDEITEAAKLTKAHDFIRKLPDGYDTMLSSDGGSLSQGEKQLLCITRIMLSLPPLLILDEATSSIDTRTEQKIQGAFRRMMQNRTTFIVAHRLSTVRESDIILYMEGGNVKEQGTHEQLLAAGGGYATLYKNADYHAANGG